MPPRKIQKRLVSTYVTRKKSGKWTARVVKRESEARTTEKSPRVAVSEARKKTEG